MELISAILIAIGIVFIHIMVTKTQNEPNRFMMMFFLSVIMIYTGIVMLNITWDLFISKINALLVLIAGIFFAYFFQGNVAEGYQHEGFSIVGMFIGIILTILGLYWLIF